MTYPFPFAFFTKAICSGALFPGTTMNVPTVPRYEELSVPPDSESCFPIPEPAAARAKLSVIIILCASALGSASVSADAEEARKNDRAVNTDLSFELARLRKISGIEPPNKNQKSKREGRKADPA